MQWKAERDTLDDMSRDAKLSILRQIRDYTLNGESVPARLATQLRDLNRPGTAPLYQTVGKSLKDITPTLAPLAVRQDPVRPATAPPAPASAPPPPRPQVFPQYSNQDARRTGSKLPILFLQGNWSQDPSFDPSTSMNPYIRGDRLHHASYANPLCYKCGIPGHKGMDCTYPALSLAEQTYLKNMIFGEINALKAAKQERMRRETEGQQAPVHLVFSGTQLHEELPFPARATGCFVGSEEEEEVVGWEDVLPRRWKVVSESVEGSGLSAAEAFAQERKRQRVDDDEKEEDATLRQVPVFEKSNWSQESGGKGKGEELKRLFTQPRKKREKKGKAAEDPLNPSEPIVVNSVETSVAEQLAAKEILKWKQRNRAYRAFGLPLKVWKENGSPKYKVPRDDAIADQGSDINLIYLELRKFLGLELRPLEELGLPKFRMTLANGAVQELRHWVHLYISIAGIDRVVWAFACTTSGTNMALLLGVPFLSSVDAKIRVRDEIIEVGDVTRGEAVMEVSTPQCALLTPKIEVEEDQEDETEDEETDESEGTDEDSGSDGSTEGDF
ncbi:hypothetical protein MMC18_009556 [Xylographa bjoerkii]|nr:hypothetical protein [Xylographa bjoerkii]